MSHITLLTNKKHWNTISKMSHVSQSDFLDKTWSLSNTINTVNIVCIPYFTHFCDMCFVSHSLTLVFKSEVYFWELMV